MLGSSMGGAGGEFGWLRGDLNMVYVSWKDKMGWGGGMVCFFFLVWNEMRNDKK